MDVDVQKGDIDFAFFDSGDENDAGMKAAKRSENGSPHLSKSKKSLQKHDRIHSNNNTRPSNSAELVNGEIESLSLNDKSNQGTGSEADSLSRSPSDGGNTSRTVSSRTTNISVKLPTAALAYESDSDHEHSSHTNVDECNNNNIPYKLNPSQSENPYPSTNMKSEREKARPQTAKSRDHKKSWSSEDSSDASRSTYSADSDSGSSLSSKHDSDSDGSVTDVSPLHSPDRGRKTQDRPKYVNQTQSPKAKDKKRKSDGVRFVEVTPGCSIHGNDTHPQDTEARELSRLLKAVLEMDEHPTRTELDSFQKQMSRPSSGKVRSGGQRPQSAHLPHHRMNMSFSNEEVRRIDRENQRLLSKIVNNKSNVSAAQRSKPSQQNMSHSAIRRMREQRKIESENMRILRKIESAKASPSVQKDNLTQHYRKQVQYSSQVGKSPHRPNSARRTGSTYVNKMAKASSMTSLNSDFSHRSVASSSRLSSGKHSIVSDMGPPARSRPVWDEHWHAG